MSQHAGSCLCGAVRFEVAGELERFYLCHCQHCRKGSGSAHAANLFSSSASLRWVSGAGQVRRFDLPSTLHSRSFCSICGSPLPSIQMNGALLVVPAGALDTALGRKPDAHLFVASRAGWDQGLEHVPQLAGPPS